MAWIGLFVSDLDLLSHVLRSNKAILDFVFQDDNLLPVKGLDSGHFSVSTLDLGWY